jgi:hypothetical protein
LRFAKAAPAAAFRVKKWLAAQKCSANSLANPFFFIALAQGVWLLGVDPSHSPMFFRVKPAGHYRYLQIAHSVREGKKVRQQVIATLGRLDLLQQSGQLDRLMRSGVRHCQSFAVLDAHAAGQMEPVSVRRIGPDLVFGRLWQESGLPDTLHALREGPSLWV